LLVAVDVVGIVGVRVSDLYVLWDDELRDAFNEFARREGVGRAARILNMQERVFWDYRHGYSRAGQHRGRRTARKFLALPVLERLAVALDDPMLENREALSQREWCDRGAWAYFSETAA
jgi:hypothetical protein